MTKRLLPYLLLLALATQVAAENKPTWHHLFDGKTLKGWKANENAKSWSVKDGTIVCSGRRSHLFYVGDKAPFLNFELRVDVKTTPGSNSGIYFLTQYQGRGWPKAGYEAQINNSYRGDERRTGSLYGLVDVKESPVKDGEWFTLTVISVDKKVNVRVNSQPVAHHLLDDFQRGTVALQAHYRNSKVYFKNIIVRDLSPWK